MPTVQMKKECQISDIKCLKNTVVQHYLQGVIPGAPVDTKCVDGCSGPFYRCSTVNMVSPSYSWYRDEATCC